MSAPDAQGALQHLLVLLVKAALTDGTAEAAAWTEEARAAARGLAYDGIGADRLNAIWDRAVREAERDPLVRRDETVNPMLPRQCPLAFEPSLDVAGAIQAIRDTASFG